MKQLLRLGLAMFLLLTLPQFAFAQYNTNLQFNAGNPRNLNTTSDTATVGWTTITAGGENSNSWSAVQSLPFNFAFYGTPVTGFKVSRNGLLTFNTGTGVLPNANADMPTNVLPNQTIACYWDEFSAAPPLPANSKVYTRVFGAAGSRQLWIKWTNYEIGNPVCSFANFACVLEEGSNKVYVIDMNYSAIANVTATIGLQNTNSQAIQFGSSNFGFFSTNSGPAVADNDYYEFTPQQTSDAGVVSIDSPTVPFGSGISNVKVTIKNFSQSVLSNVTVKWKVNNVPQPDFVYNSSLAPNASASNINIGTFNFVDGFTYTIEAETNNPNGTSDINPANDKATRSVCPMLLGNYVIGGVNGRFQTITEAVNMLQCGGVETAVKFTLAPGTGPYNETVSIDPVPGSSRLNTVTFDGGTAKEKISGNGAYTIRLNGADHIILQNLTIENLSAASSAGIFLISRADSNIIRNNYFPLKSAGTGLVSFAGVAFGVPGNTGGLPNNGFYNLVENNLFENGNIAVNMRATNAGFDIQNRVVGNTIINAGMVAISSAFQKMPFIQNNTINFIAGSNNTNGIQSDNNDNFEISGNIIKNFSSGGIRINNGNNISGGTSSRAKIQNNMLISLPGSFGDGITIGFGSAFIDIFHNSISINNGSGDGIFISGGNSIGVVNNTSALFSPTGTFGRAFYATTSITYSAFDHNNFYVPSGNVVRINNSDLGPTGFQGFAGYNSNSYFGNPGYLDPASDLHAITTQLNNKGDNSVGVTKDIDGENRPSTGGIVDIGADEFTIFPNDIAVTALVSPKLNGRVFTSKTLTSSEIITVKLTNSGGNPLMNIPIYYKLNGVTAAVESVPGPINPGTTVNYTFTAPANMAAVGTYNLQVYTAFATDDDKTNDTLATVQLKQLPNAPVTFPITEGFENTGTLVLSGNYVGLPGAERFDYESNNLDGRLRSFAGTGFAKTGLRAITFDRSNFGSVKPINYLVMTMNLAGYTTTDVMMLDFAYVTHGNIFQDDAANRVWVRGSDTDNWVEAYNLYFNKIGPGNYKNVTNINLSAILAAAGQTYSSSTQIRFGQSGNNRATTSTCCDGYSFDDIAVRKLNQTDLGITALVQPTANACGDSVQTVSVTVKNYGVATKSNIPVTVKISGAKNATLTGTLAGPLTTEQTATLNLGTLNTYAGGSFTFKAYTNMTGEEDRKNDTLKTTIFLNAIPIKPTAVAAATCAGETATLQVNGTANSYNFYATNSSSTILGNSAAGTFTTPVLTSNTTYYASAVNSTAATVGPVDETFGVGGAINQYEAGLEFNVLRNLILDGVYVYPASAGNVKINLLNASGTVIASKTVAVTTPNVKTLIPLDFKIAPGNGYRLNAVGSTVTALFRNTNGAVYPYQIPQALAITNGTFGVGPFYYFFYDWRVTVLECESRRVPVNVTVNPRPTVNLGADIKNCNGGPVSLDAANAGNGFTYLWSTGGTSQTTSATASGQYWVKVTNPITGCFKYDTINVFIGTSPVVNLGGPVTQCGGPAILDAGNAGLGYSYIWSTGATTQSTGVNTSGTYSVTVTNPATGCATTSQVQVTINPKPTVNLGADRTQCEGTVTLDAGNSGSGFTYLWSTGATTQTAAITISGKYNVKVTNPATGCFNTDTINVTINAKPVVNLGAAITQCGGTATLDAGNVGLGYTYLWSNGATTRTITASTSGTYSVTVTNPATNCSNTGQVQVTINAVPNASLAFLNTAYCKDAAAITFPAAVTGNTIEYKVNGTVATTFNPQTLAAGTYTISAVETVTATGCNATTSKTVTINATPTPSLAFLNTSYCKDAATVTFPAAVTGNTIVYKVNGTAASSFDPQTLAPGTYTVTALETITATGCNATATKTVTINALPVISLANQAICTGQSATLTITPQTGVTYAWSGGQTSNSITVSPTATTTYTVTATSAGGCINSQPVTVSVNSLPTVNAGIDTATCANTPITLTATGTGTSYTWSTGQTGSSITVSPSANTTYTVTATNTNNCTATDQVLVKVRTSPAIPTITAAGPVLTSSAAAGNQWYLNGTLIPGATAQNYTPSVNGNYTVTTTLGQCTATSIAYPYNITGVADEVLNAQLQVYPNPTTGNFEVKLANQHKPVMLTLYNLTGQLLAEVEVKPTTTKTLAHTFDLSNYAQGIYVLKLETAGKTAFRKVVKE